MKRKRCSVNSKVYCKSLPLPDHKNLRDPQEFLPFSHHRSSDERPLLINVSLEVGIFDNELRFSRNIRLEYLT